MYKIEQYNTPNLPRDFYVSLNGIKITDTTPNFKTADFMLTVCKQNAVTEYSSYRKLADLETTIP